MEKRCYRCKEAKDGSEFRKNKSKKDGLSAECKQCGVVLDRERYAKNPEKWREYERKLRERDPEAFKIKSREAQARYRANPDNTIRLRYIKSRYGIDIDQYVEMEVQQDGKCAICKKAPNDGKRLAVDHDHQTGAVRSLLCFHCNAMLGQAQDSMEILTAAIEYLTLHRKPLTSSQAAPTLSPEG